MKQGGPIKRNTPLARTGSLERAAFKRSLPEPRTPEEGGDEGYKAFARTLPCEVCGAPGPSDPMHVGRRGYGEKSADPCVLPGCRPCHEVWHQNGIVAFLVLLNQHGHREVDALAWCWEHVALRNRDYGDHLRRLAMGVVF